MVPPPNILLLVADQHRYDCIGANGHPVIQTPHLDRLAAEGVNFAHAFSPIPVCIPARNTLLHGQWSASHLSIANWNTEAPRPARDGLPAFTQNLRSAGYTLAHVGKWHIHPQNGPACYGFQTDVPDSGYAAWREAMGWPPKPKTEWTGGADPQAPPEASRLAWGADRVIEQLEACAETDAPFFVHWETNEPHLPSIVPEPYATMYPPEEVPPWPGFPDPLTGKPYIQAQQRRTWRVDGWTWENWAPVVGRYMGEVSLLDAQVGRILQALDRLGLSENTLVMYTADHGDMCGGHGMVDKHYIMYDDVVRIPFTARWPERIPAGGRCNAFVSLIDLASTFCNVAGVPIPDAFQGQSLLPFLSNPEKPGRKDILAMYHGNQFGLYSQRMVRNARWKYVWNATAEDELYDLQTDPGEIRNRATDPACRNELTRLRSRLVAWMEAISDPLLNHWNRAQLLEGLTI